MAKKKIARKRRNRGSKVSGNGAFIVLNFNDGLAYRFPDESKMESYVRDEIEHEEVNPCDIFMFHATSTYEMLLDERVILDGIARQMIRT